MSEYNMAGHNNLPSHVTAFSADLKKSHHSQTRYTYRQRFAMCYML